MRAVVQRVLQASVTVEGEVVGAIGSGLFVLLGASEDDDEKDVRYLANKIVGLRIFGDEQGLMNLGLQEIDGEMLVVSQFTLLGDCRKGRRPSFAHAMEPRRAEELCDLFVAVCRDAGVRKVETGRFGAYMEIDLLNTGPVTMLVDSKRIF